jgi:hypothetical protein
MREKLALCLLPICLQGGIEDRLKVGGGGGGGGGGNGVSPGHEFVLRAREQVSGWQREGAVRLVFSDGHGDKQTLVLF